MYRFALAHLLTWKRSPHRKPLLLKGVRQVGKTWLLKTFGAEHYKNTAYFRYMSRYLKIFLGDKFPFIQF